MKPLLNNGLLIGLFLAFSSIAACGIFLVYISVQFSTPALSKNPTDSTVDIKLNSRGIQVKLSTGIPGLMVFLLGGVGLLVLAVRVPVRQITGYKKPRTPTRDAIGLATLDWMNQKLPEPILSERIERIPILLWWLIQRKGGIAVRVQNEKSA